MDRHGTRLTGSGIDVWHKGNPKVSDSSHEMLYEAPDLTTVRMNELLQGLTNVATQAPDRPDISVDVSDLSLPIDVAIPLSLIASELITKRSSTRDRRTESCGSRYR